MDALKNTVRGRVLVAGEDGFEQARRPWNLAVEQPVAAVVEAADAEDVAAVVRFAKGAGPAVAPQATGHGASGEVGGVILLRTAALDELEIRAEERIARVGAGMQWGRVQAAAEPHGLTGLPGSSPVVGVAGYTLGGGLSWFGRRYGWASDGVRAFDVVDADGERSRVTADTDADLFWALCGGGGSHALVTAIEYALHPAPALYGGRMLWPAARAAEVFAAYREITATAPDELTVWFDLLHFPGADPMVAVDATYLGDAHEGEALLAGLAGIGGLIGDGRRAMALTELAGITAEPTAPSAGLSRGDLLTGLDDTVVEALLDEPIAPLLSVQIRHLGGALAGPSQGAAGTLTEPYSLYMLGIPGTPERAAAVRAKQDEVVRALGSSLSGRKPFTNLAPGDDGTTAFPAETVARLRDIKRLRDPHGVIRGNYPLG
ncbi:FAD-binding oxidoreductase [Thermomonospora umbrina]|uniref:FAD/FMN-containing dehydrogenase n=1 Tax=Thermomonospora umbrina TaxID=111806 RepID=A0A3D9T3R8_9ACTN|nr:FAD-binding oxidoreductase [Thermomonospora umbrina]REE98451.1 FAD/FMN-containing dehydrogenase [Thermomonospora umbrina]